MEQTFPRVFEISADDAGRRLDQFLVGCLTEVSRARVQQLIAQGQVRVDGAPAKASLRLRAGQTVSLLGPAQAPPLRAIAEEIPVDVVYEDESLAVVNKPAGMMVHAGAGRQEARARGTLVNALLYRFSRLSGVGGELRPGIVHRLDKDTSGLLVVAKDDLAHRRLAEQFSRRTVRKKYIALVHGWLKQEKGTIESSIARDRLRRTRMTTRRRAGRQALSHYQVLRRLDSAYGKFSLLEVRIETGRTHQIRVQLASLGHPVVGDSLYGAPRELKDKAGRHVSLPRNFLHAAAIEFEHPKTGAPLAFARPLPPDLEDFLARLKAG